MDVDHAARVLVRDPQLLEEAGQDNRVRPAQEVLMLHHLLGLSFLEVGQVLGIAAGTAKVRAHRALKAVRAQLEEQGGEA